MNNVRKVSDVCFPAPQGRSINMMPFLMGDPESLPRELHDYLDLINACPVDDQHGLVGYLTIDERFVQAGTHRRGGVHTEGFGAVGAWGGGGWGGGSPAGSWGRGSWGGGGAWGGSGGLYIANTVPDSCRIFDTCVPVSGPGGEVDEAILVDASSFTMPANELFWIHDRTPHASLPVSNTMRQFFRLVTNEVSIWYAEHSTPNPLGIKPTAQIVHHNKFG